MTVRLIWSIISTLLEETALVVVVLLWLPEVGIDIPLPVLIAVMMLWGGIAVLTYLAGSRALNRELLLGLPHMIGTKGVVVSPLVPEGLVRIKGELWVAKSENGDIEEGRHVAVVGQDRLKLVVSSRHPAS